MCCKQQNIVCKTQQNGIANLRSLGISALIVCIQRQSHFPAEGKESGRQVKSACMYSLSATFPSSYPDLQGHSASQILAAENPALGKWQCTFNVTQGSSPLSVY